MSDGRRLLQPPRRWIVFAVAGAVALCDAGGQRIRTDSIRAEIRRIASRTAAARRRGDSIEAVLRARATDTAVVGAITIAAPAAIVGHARAGAEQAWTEIVRQVGDTRARALVANGVVTISADSQRAFVTTSRFYRVSLFMDGRSKVSSERLDRISPDVAEAVSRFLQEQVRIRLNATSDPLLLVWREIPTRDSLTRRQLAQDAFISLTAAGSIPARRCAAGVLQSCAVALGLVASEHPWDEWFLARERRAIGRRLFEGLRSNHVVDSTAHDPCDAEPISDECERWLRRLPSSSVPPPMRGAGRDLLLLTALELGGAGSLDRLYASAGRPLADRLAASAGTSRDSLLAAWRVRVLAARTESVALAPSAVLAALAGALLLGMGALAHREWLA